MKIKIENRIACVLVGIFFLLIPYYLKTEYENKKTELDSVAQSIQTTYKKHYSYSGERHHRRTMYTPEYHFLVGKTSYVCTSKYSSSSIPTNTPKKIYYNSYNPMDCLPENGTEADVISHAIGIAGVIVILFGLLYKEPGR